jgi:signal recognition particle receptor subunit beta
MVQINFANKEIQCKIVYYGPGMSGKTTNLEVVHKKAPAGSKGELTSIATEGDRTLFFDFMPLDLGNIAGIKTKFQLYTVPGQVYYNSTRKLVLQGVDGIVFVVDSQAEKLEDNIESLENLKANLREYGRDIDSIPVVFQWNKRDLPTALPVETLQQKLNPGNAPSFEAVASTGEGVFPTLKALASLVLESINRDKRETGLSEARVVASAAAAGAARTATVAPPRRPVAAPAAPPPSPAAGRPAAAAAPARPAPAPAPARPAERVAARAPAPPPGNGMPASRAPRPEPMPVAKPSNRPVGKVKIRERGDRSRLLVTVLVAVVILAAVGFLIMNYL